MKAKIIASGIIAKIASHDPYISIIIVINTEVSVPNADENEPGNNESIESTSFAKRFIILPTGVVSKKAIGVRSTPINKDECSVLLAVKAAKYTQSCIKRVINPRINERKNEAKFILFYHQA